MKKLLLISTVFLVLTACENLDKKQKNKNKTDSQISQDTVVVTTITCEIKDEWLKNRDLATADTYPIIINAAELAKDFHVDVSFFDGYPRNYKLFYQYFVTINENGEVDKFEFQVADNLRIDKQVEKNIKKLKFQPATKNNVSVESYTIVEYRFQLAKRQ